MGRLLWGFRFRGLGLESRGRDRLRTYFDSSVVQFHLFESVSGRNLVT